MPVASRNGIKLYYESTGSGPPVLMVMGLGMTANGWWRTVPVLAAGGFEVIAFDNRGVGRSDHPRGPYTTAQMADDAVAVLGASGHDTAHVYGMSLGGMIAQEIALRHPEKVDRLVLGATSAGGRAGVSPDLATMLKFLRRPAKRSAEDVYRSWAPYVYGPSTVELHGDRIAEDIAQRLTHAVKSKPYRAQVAAGVNHRAGKRLQDIAAPTLIVHGGQDRIVPPANAEVLRSLIPNAESRIWPEAGHMYFTDEPAADRHVASFLAGT